MSGYSCKACGAPANVDAHGITRFCDCGTTVVASMNAVAYGRGHVAEASATEKLLAAFHAVGLSVLKALRAGV